MPKQLDDFIEWLTDVITARVMERVRAEQGEILAHTLRSDIPVTQQNVEALSVDWRTYSLLKQLGCVTIADAASLYERLSKQPHKLPKNFGPITVNRLRIALAQLSNHGGAT